MLRHLLSKAASSQVHLFHRFGTPPSKERQRGFVAPKFIGKFAFFQPSRGPLRGPRQLTLNQTREGNKIPLQAFSAVNGENLHTPRFGFLRPRGQVVFALCLLEPLDKASHPRVIGKSQIPRQGFHKSVSRCPREVPLGVGEQFNIEPQLLLNRHHQFGNITKPLGLQGGEHPVGIGETLQAQRGIPFPLVMTLRGLGNKEHRIQQAGVIA